MSKVTRVIVLCPNGRRQTVNLTPNSSILQILEEVCQKQNINPDDFDICHYNKPLDLTLPIRFANILNNAQLELQPAKTARKDCYVSVALQLESGERIMKEFLPSTSVWDVMEQCLSMKSDKINMDQKVEPVCIYMRQKLIGDAIKKTTLRSLGLTKGSAIIRLMYRNPEDLSDQAHVSSLLSKPVSTAFSNNKFSDTGKEMECNQSSEKPKIECKIDSIPQNVNAPNSVHGNRDLGQGFSSVNKNSEHLKHCEMKVEENVTKKHSNQVISTMEMSLAKDTVLLDSSKNIPLLTTDDKMELDPINRNKDSPQEQEIGAIHYIGGRHAVVYSLNDITDVKKADLPDEFFELTVDDARYMMEEFKRSRMELENQPLLTKELRNRQILQKLGRFKETVIRIYFPERLVLQAVFEAQETVQDVCDFIRNYLEDQSLSFYLYTSPPKEKKDPMKTLIESMLIPASVVYFGCDNHKPSYLMNNLREKISDPRVASLAAYESRKQAMRETDEISSQLEEVPITSTEAEAVVDENQVPGPSFYEPSNRVQATKKVPKWLKLSRK